VAIAVAAIAAASGDRRSSAASRRPRCCSACRPTFGPGGDLRRVLVERRQDAVRRGQRAGGINGRKLKVIVEDQAYQVPKAVQACNKLINRDKVFAFVGPLGTPMNNACFKDQFAAGVPNLFPLSAARSMYEPFERLKFYGAASYVDQIRAGINYFVKNKGVKNVCVMYQDTDFGKEILEGAKEQAEKLGIKLARRRRTSRPTRTSPRRSPSCARRSAS
jgi:branched-chain amino acid transport system substrate-binding protein